MRDTRGEGGRKANNGKEEKGSEEQGGVGEELERIKRVSERR